MNGRAVIIAVAALIGLHSAGDAWSDDRTGQADSSATVPLKMPLRGRPKVKLRRDPDGAHRYVVFDPDGARVLTPDQLAERLYNEHVSRSLLHRLFNISGPIGIAWVTLGFLGQAMFTGRMLVQWLASERSRRSVVPTLFWWLSICGGSMLLTYFIWRKDIVGIVGQSTGVFIYARNLVLITRSGNHRD